MNQDPDISRLLGLHADRMFYPPSVSTLLNGRLPFDERLLPGLRRERLNAEVLQSEQRADEFLVVTPALEGALVDLLAHLPLTRGQHRTIRLLEFQTAWIP
ncbi:MAG TPA: hypothetical protein VMD03_08705, partial [Steroidobacteraceae bacterium]|nr:hypothetical protein [Steroidobacteraceae bacterium]